MGRTSSANSVSQMKISAPEWLRMYSTSGGLELAQADVRAAEGRHAPGEAPAVAVEHRQGPEVDRVGSHVRFHDLVDGVEVGPAV